MELSYDEVILEETRSLTQYDCVLTRKGHLKENSM